MLDQSVYRYSMIKTISSLLRIPCRPNGGILVSGLFCVASQICLNRISESGKRAFIAIRGGPILPGCLPSAMIWQARQLPLLFSMASAFPRAGVSSPKAPEMPPTIMKTHAKTSTTGDKFLLPGAAEILLFSTINLTRRITNKIYSHNVALLPFLTIRNTPTFYFPIQKLEKIAPNRSSGRY